MWKPAFTTFMTWLTRFDSSESWQVRMDLSQYVVELHSWMSNVKIYWVIWLCYLSSMSSSFEILKLLLLSIKTKMSKNSTIVVLVRWVGAIRSIKEGTYWDGHGHPPLLVLSHFLRTTAPQEVRQKKDLCLPRTGLFGTGGKLLL